MRVKLGPLQVFAVGRVAGVIHVTTPGARSIRRAYPSQAPTAAQRRCRSNWAQVDLAWQDLDATDRAAWNAYRKWERLFGYNQFMRVNIPRGLLGQDLITNPADIP